jgi:hypothetical protein
MRTFPAITFLAGALCAASVPAFASDQVILVGRITIKASTMTTMAAGTGATHAAMTIATPKSSGAPTSMLKKADLTCSDLQVHVYSAAGALVRTVTADDLPGGLCHYQVTFFDPLRSSRDVITVKVDSPHFKVAGSTRVHLDTATQGGFTAGDVVVVRY